MQNQIIELFENHADYRASRLREFLRQPEPNEANLRYFLRFQKHFYHFVRVFSKMLARCAADIEHTQHREHLIDNLMCEHGLPTGKPHVETYLHYLNCLAKHLKQKPFSHDEVRDLHDETVQKIVADFEHFGVAYPDNILFLGGIEYVYAVISQDVVAFLQKYGAELANEQEHYAIHADLDWEHGWELVEIYLNIQEDNQQAIDRDHVFHILQQGAKHLIDYIEKLMDLESVSDKPLGFYYSREDVNVEREIIKNHFANQNDMRILAICGGGENHIHLANAFPEKRFTVDLIDINHNQLALAQSKLQRNERAFRQPEHQGKFEHLFAELRRYDDLRHACETVFHRDNLIAYFGEQAVLGCQAARHNPLVFAEHFYQAFKQQPEHANTKNILQNQSLETELTQNNFQAACYQVWHIAQTPPEKLKKPYDFIMLSNVLDWVAEADIAQTLANVAQLSDEKTLLLVRKLLSDYDIFAMAQRAGWQIVADSDRQPELKDGTGFYKQSFVLKLKS